MTIYAVGNKKGGVGKSTMAIQLATGLALAGRRVLAVDGDGSQTSMLLALTARIQAGYEGIAAVGLADGATLRAQVKLQAPAYDDVVIDVGARDSATFRAALSVCDVLVVPFAPRSFDVWGFEDSVELIKEAQKNHAFAVVAFLNKADPASQAHDNDAACADVARHEFEVIAVRVGDRKGISHASSQGLHVTEFAGADKNARREVGELVKALIDYTST